MSTSISSFATPSPLTGGGAPAGQSPVQVGPSAGPGAQGGGPAAQSPMQVPMVPAAVQGASGGGALAQTAPGPAPAPVPAPAPAPAPVPAPAPAPPAPAPVSGGGAANTDIASILPALQQVVATLSALVTQLGSQAGAAQGQAGAAAVQGGGETAVAAESGTPQEAPPSSGCGCGHAKGAAEGVAAGTAGAASQPAGDAGDGQYSKPEKQLPEAPKVPGSGDGALNSDSLTVKGVKMTAEQKRLAEIVLRKGKEMGANQKVLETAVATMIQESVIKNDSSVDGKDHDSLGLFQQRPSAGWGTREQISDPEYAAQKFFEKAIPNDRKNPDQAKTRLAQSVQISAVPDGYAKWDKEAEQIVADFTS